MIDQHRRDEEPGAPLVGATTALILLLRDILFFEAGEDDNRELYLAPGVLPPWLSGGGLSISITAAPTSCGATFGHTLRHDEPTSRILIDIPRPLPATPTPAGSVK
ncbi:hypothetical protein [Pseudonocardia adelaidensis]|uniref:Uncharacterized protein n=1 Tax=Pseudonocardia adelaidensis TaxID=648754 RepID=A0ABP9NE76_9PSEU